MKFEHKLNDIGRKDLMFAGFPAIFFYGILHAG